MGADLFLNPPRDDNEKLKAAVARAERLETAYRSAQEQVSSLSLLVRAVLPESQWPAVVVEMKRAAEAEHDRLTARVAELEALNQKRANERAAIADSTAALVMRVSELEAQLVRQTFIANRLPPVGELVELLVLGQWEPRIVPEARGRWRDQRYEVLNDVQGWRPRQEQ